MALSCSQAQPVTLVWNHVNNPGTIRYYWELYNRKTGELLATDNTTSTSDTASLPCDTSAFWHVRAVDDSGQASPGPNSDDGFFYVQPPPPQDSTGPTILKPDADPNPSYYYNGSCGSTTTTVSAQVTDESGVASVTIQYYYEGTSGSGKQQSEPAGSSWDFYFLAIDNGLTKGPADEALNTQDGYLVWSITAFDQLGNSTYSGDFRVPLMTCIP